MQLIINLDVDSLRHANALDADLTVQTGAVIQGMQSRAIVLDRRDQHDVLGIVFEPGAGRTVLGTPMDAVTDAHVDLDELVRGQAPLRQQLLGVATADERFDRIERWLRARIAGEPDPLVRAALAHMSRGEQRVAVLASRLGTSERTLRRRFCAEVGLAPKPMSRVFRLQRALEALRGPGTLADVAVASGYHDQAHLTHELRELGGVSPSHYRRQSPRHRNHLP